MAVIQSGEETWDTVARTYTRTVNGVVVETRALTDAEIALLEAVLAQPTDQAAAKADRVALLAFLDDPNVTAALDAANGSLDLTAIHRVIKDLIRQARRQARRTT